MSSRKKARENSESADASAAVPVAVRTALALSSRAGPSRPMRVTAMAAKAVELTAKQQQLTEEEERTLRTRLQYRLYQRNHRAKKQRRMEELERQVAALRLQVTALEEERTAKAKALIQSAIKRFVEVFHADQRSIEDVLQGLLGGEAYQRSQLSKQWKLLNESFLEWKLAVEDDVEFVLSRRTDAKMGFMGLSRIVLEFKATENQLASLFLSSADHDDREVVMKLAAAGSLSVPASAIVEVIAGGNIITLSVDLDWTKVLMQIGTATVEEVARLGTACALRRIGIDEDMDRENWAEAEVAAASRGGGQEEALRVTGDSSEEDGARDRRLSIDFLLA